MTVIFPRFLSLFVRQRQRHRHAEQAAGFFRPEGPAVVLENPAAGIQPGDRRPAGYWSAQGVHYDAVSGGSGRGPAA